MELNFVLKEKEPSISKIISVPVTEEIERDLQRIKGSSQRNRRMVNELARQFFTQLIKKYDEGGFELTGS